MTLRKFSCRPDPNRLYPNEHFVWRFPSDPQNDSDHFKTVTEYFHKYEDPEREIFVLVVDFQIYSAKDFCHGFPNRHAHVELRNAELNGHRYAVISGALLSAEAPCQVWIPTGEIEGNALATITRAAAYQATAGAGKASLLPMVDDWTAHQIIWPRHCPDCGAIHS